MLRLKSILPVRKGFDNKPLAYRQGYADGYRDANSSKGAGFKLDKIRSTSELSGSKGADYDTGYMDGWNVVVG